MNPTWVSDFAAVMTSVACITSREFRMQERCANHDEQVTVFERQVNRKSLPSFLPLRASERKLLRGNDERPRGDLEKSPKVAGMAVFLILCQHEYIIVSIDRHFSYGMNTKFTPFCPVAAQPMKKNQSSPAPACTAPTRLARPAAGCGSAVPSVVAGA